MTKWRGLLWLLVILVLIATPLLGDNSYYLHLIIVIMIFSILTLGLDLVFGYSGEVSIGHASLLGIGAYTAGVLAFKLSIGFWIALPMAMAMGAIFGLILALPALRVTGPYLAMVTLAFGTIVQILINEMSFLTHGPQGITLHTPLIIDINSWIQSIFGTAPSIKRLKGIEYFYLVGACLLLTIALVNRIVHSRFGRAFEALRDSPAASDCMGVSVYKHKVIAFVLSAALAGLAGCLFAYSEQYIAPNNFTFELSILFLLAVTMGGRKSRLGPILGAAIIVYLPNILADIVLFRYVAGGIAAIALVAGAVILRNKKEGWQQYMIPISLCLLFFVFSLWLPEITDYKLSIFGAMILFVVYYLPDGIVGFFKAIELPFLRNKSLATIAISPQQQAIWGDKITNNTNDKAIKASKANKGQSATESLLVVTNLVKQFGGLRALDGIDLEVSVGTIHGLIGPNGSGKSTMINVLTGIYVPTSGTIALAGKTLKGVKSAKIASLGIARTFQNVQLFSELSLQQNIMVGLNHRYRSGFIETALGLPRARRDEREASEIAMSLLAFVGLQDSAHELAKNLPYGKQRLLEIARALALQPKLLLLDEPAAGLTAPDIKELVKIIRKIRDQGITIILIEHHMDLVMGICDQVTVLDHGQKIAEGKPAAVQKHPRVIEAYLGAAAVTAFSQKN